MGDVMILTLQDRATSLAHSVHPMSVAGISQSAVEAPADALGPDAFAIVTMKDGSQFIAAVGYREAMRKWQKALSAWLPAASSGE